MEIRNLPALFVLVLALFGPNLKAAEKIRVAAGAAAFEIFLNQVKVPFETKTSIALEYKVFTAQETILKVADGISDVAFTVGTIDYAKERVMTLRPDFKDMKKIVPTLMGSDRVKIIVNADAKISELNHEQVLALTLGTTKNWSELGGADLPIKYIRPGGYAGTWWEKEVLKGKKLREPDFNEGNSGIIAETVAKHAGGFAFGPKNIKPDPNVVNVAIPVYGRPIYAYTFGKPKDSVLKFFEFIKVEGKKLYE